MKKISILFILTLIVSLLLIAYCDDPVSSTTTTTVASGTPGYQARIYFYPLGNYTNHWSFPTGFVPTHWIRIARGISDDAVPMPGIDEQRCQWIERTTAPVDEVWEPAEQPFVEFLTNTNTGETNQTNNITCNEAWFFNFKGSGLGQFTNQVGLVESGGTEIYYGTNSRNETNSNFGFMGGTNTLARISQSGIGENSVYSFTVPWAATPTEGAICNVDKAVLFGQYSWWEGSEETGGNAGLVAAVPEQPSNGVGVFVIEDVLTNFTTNTLGTEQKGLSTDIATRNFFKNFSVTYNTNTSGDIESVTFKIYSSFIYANWSPALDHTIWSCVLMIDDGTSFASVR